MKDSKQLPPQLFLIFSIILMCMMNRYIPGFVVFTGKVSHIIGIMFVIFGTAMMYSAEKFMKKAGVEPYTQDAPAKLVKDGPFAYTRNPMYLGMVLILIGMFFNMGASTALIVVLLFGATMEDRFVKSEEKMLKEKFGKEYKEYSIKVSKWFPLLTDFAYEKTKK